MALLNAISILLSEATIYTPIGAGLAMVGLLGAGIGMGIAIAKTMEAAARQPELLGGLQRLLIIGLAFIETCIIFGMVGAILIIVL